jgi:hypothetical protein
MRKCCFSSWPLTPSMSAWAASLWMKCTGNPTKAQCANCSKAALNSYSDLLLSWILALC